MGPIFMAVVREFRYFWKICLIFCFNNIINCKARFEAPAVGYFCKMFTDAGHVFRKEN